MNLLKLVSCLLNILIFFPVDYSTSIKEYSCEPLIYLRPLKSYTVYYNTQYTYSSNDDWNSPGSIYMCYKFKKIRNKFIV